MATTAMWVWCAKWLARARWVFGPPNTKPPPCKYNTTPGAAGTVFTGRCHSQGNSASIARSRLTPRACGKQQVSKRSTARCNARGTGGRINPRNKTRKPVRKRKRNTAWSSVSDGMCMRIIIDRSASPTALPQRAQARMAAAKPERVGM